MSRMKEHTIDYISGYRPDIRGNRIFVPGMKHPVAYFIGEPADAVVTINGLLVYVANNGKTYTMVPDQSERVAAVVREHDRSRGGFAGGRLYGRHTVDHGNTIPATRIVAETISDTRPIDTKETGMKTDIDDPADLRKAIAEQDNRLGILECKVAGLQIIVKRQEERMAALEARLAELRRMQRETDAATQAVLSRHAGPEPDWTQGGGLREGVAVPEDSGNPFVRRPGR